MDEDAQLAELNTTEACLAWMAHQPGCDCAGCLYVEHHLDDDDDTPDTFDQYVSDVAMGRRAGEKVWP